MMTRKPKNENPFHPLNPLLQNFSWSRMMTRKPKKKNPFHPLNPLLQKRALLSRTSVF